MNIYTICKVVDFIYRLIDPDQLMLAGLIA